MEIKISNKNGIILKTANKLCTENITLILDENLFGPFLTLICDSDVLNSSNYQYSIDSGTTWNQFTSETIVLENVETIRFKNTEDTTHIVLGIGTTHIDTSDEVDIAKVGGNYATESDDITITENTTWYVYRYSTSHNGGSDD